MLDTEREYDLREHLYQKRMTITEFADKIHASRAYISHIINGNKKPGRRLAKDIERGTDGLVTAESLMK